MRHRDVGIEFVAVHTLRTLPHRQGERKEPAVVTVQDVAALRGEAEDGAGTADVVAFLGPEGTFTSEAAERAAPDRPRLPLPSIGEVVDAVREGRAKVGVVPIENSIEGGVNLTSDALVFGPPGAFLRGELTLPIEMALLAGTGTALSEVREVRSMPVALAQCRARLNAVLPDVAVTATASTAEAARQAAEGANVAALAPPRAAQRYGLDVLVPDLADHPGNTTRFVVLGREMAAPTGADKTSLVVFFGEDRPGLLLRVLEEFALRGINLTKIESRPTKRALGQYCILVDCEGHPTEARVGEALRSVHRHVAEVRILGAYPRADFQPVVAGPADSDAAYADAADWYAGLLRDVEA
jgi:prephenate dehydratase